MLKLDRNDPLDRMLLKELSGNPVLFDEWLDAMDELADEPDCEQILRERGLDREAVLREAQKYRADFRARLAERELPVYDRFTLCRCSATRFLRISDKINEKKLLAFSRESHEHMQESICPSA